MVWGTHILGNPHLKTMKCQKTWVFRWGLSHDFRQPLATPKSHKNRRTETPALRSHSKGSFNASTYDRGVVSGSQRKTRRVALSDISCDRGEPGENADKCR